MSQSDGSSVGTFLGTTLLLVGAVMILVLTFVITANFLQLLVFLVLSLIGGYGLGSMQSEKAQSSSSYKNEYVLYSTIGFVGAILWAGYIYLFDPELSGTLILNNQMGLNEMGVLLASLISGIATQFGLGLVVNNLVSN